MIMGRKIWFSILEKTQPLKEGINLMLSRDLKEPPQEGHFLAKSLYDPLKFIEQGHLGGSVVERLSVFGSGHDPQVLG
ncbi:unnamed protein product [Nyctereutes procyonoides]|uniref:(raccoon dog) hypothetical protein n=1 Tax=Nyctereutes procyonoides TaxID=34880 RepID=A0A811Y6C0_NYCPR|nr:unnamed protein product [Nyctereutes procyonoides]